MGNSKKSSRRKKNKASSPRTVVTIEKILGSANFGERHDTESAHLNPRTRPAQLPARDLDFTGRAQEIDTLCQTLTQGGAIALFGKPGVGKTALAVELAHVLAPSFSDAQLYVDLNGASGEGLDIDGVLESFLRALGFSGQEIAPGSADKVAQYRSALHGLNCIVVVDNAANESQVRQLLPGSSNSVMLVTSRQSLGGLAGVRRHRMETLPHADSAKLLAEVIGEERIHDETSAVTEISELCGGLPLALRITANRLRDRPGWTLAHYANKLKDEKRRLELLRSGDAEVRASFSLSYVGLEPAERKLFRRLGVLTASGFNEQVVSCLVDAGEVDAEILLERLVERSLLEVTPDPGRYKMHDLIRVFAQERLEEEEGSEVVAKLTAHFVYWYGHMASAADDAIFSGMGRSTDSTFSSAEEATDWLESEHQTLVDAVRLAYSRELHEAVLFIANSLTLFFERRLHGNSWRKVADYALESARHRNSKEALIGALVNYVRMSEKFPSEEDSAMSMLDEAYELAKHLGSRSHEASVLYQLGRVARDKKNLDGAKRILSRSIALAKQSKAYHTEGNSLLALSDVYEALGEHDAAISSCERARLVFLMSGDRHCQGNSWHRLGGIYLNQKNPKKAIDCFSMAGRQYDLVHDVHCSSMVGISAAQALHVTGDYVRSRILCDRAHEQLVRINDPKCETAALTLLAALDRHSGDLEAAISRLKQANEKIKQTGTRKAAIRILVELGNAIQEHSGDEASLPYFREAIATSRGMADDLTTDIPETVWNDLSLPAVE
ncbi:NB-ARC domain-containing protein [Streptomyces sp. MBT60]|uniref:tetratricopeptide repeat protein n=1 Tax=Streptomyces sp. MBT60 TaxID=2800409 RepID=UPI00190D9B6A|nr:NB-ARC domain-containing protein [Streptomyces sp. MBT60]MBK3546018.1 hypothetical protein [Streptomyces sp. MBT60]